MFEDCDIIYTLVRPIPEGSFVFQVDLATRLDVHRLREELADNHELYIGINEREEVPLAINEGILSRPLEEIVAAWRKSIKNSLL